jgi:hypothetical protein
MGVLRHSAGEDLAESQPIDPWFGNRFAHRIPLSPRS